ncbi:MAG: TonB-dependent receptor, partial [Kiloniellales bacterium]|nr:TonB-dependent receptor [Kiloniellales bacterium]
GNWGTVVSYTGANAEGAWNTERLRFNDFYAALGWKGIQSDFTFSTVYFRQRDTYDETNFEGDDDGVPGNAERTFFRDIRHCKNCFEPFSKFNSFNADVVLMQGVYNYYLDSDTTITARAYGQSHRRDRFFAPDNPFGPGTSFRPLFSDGEAFIPDEGGMRGRLRTYTNFGTEVRAELANRPLMFGLSQDMQFGFRYERNDFIDRRTEGRQGKVLDAFDDPGITVRRTKHEADAFSGFFQTEIPITPVLSVVPGVRVDHYRISRRKVVAEDDDVDLDSCAAFDGQPCTVIDFADPSTESFDRTHVLPGVSFAYTKLPDTTFYGGYHRGLTMAVLRSSVFPPGDELGDNYQLGVRSTAIRGLTFDVAGFHKNITDFQTKGATTDVFGNDVFTLIDEVEINGVELYSRLDTRPFTGWTLNPYAEGSFTYADSVIERGFSEGGDSVAGNLVPEAPRETAYLTAGIESTAGWNASVSWIYRGSFFTDEENTPFGGDPSGEEGKVPSVWLLAARANYTIPDTNATVFVSGQNLTDKLYITDRADGIKPGIGRTIMAGARVKW